MPRTNLPRAPYGHLPPVMRLLHVHDHSSSGNWLADCLADDAAVEVQLDSLTASTALVRLREEAYDAILVSHHPPQLDAIELLRAIRAGSDVDQPVLVLGDAMPDEMTAICLEASADAYLCVSETSVRSLLWQIARASERHQLLSENRRWQQTYDQQRTRQHQEALHQLRQQHGLLVDHLPDELVGGDANPPSWLVDHFRQLLRIYVVAGCGNLSEEVSQLVTRLDECRVTLQEALLAHIVAVEEMVLGLGQRSTWHVISRGNLLAYELILQMTRLESAA